MPARNTVRYFAPEHIYHIYNRGANGSEIYREDDDYAYMLHLLKRHLSNEAVFDSSGRAYVKFSDSLELNAFCLMPNHFHLLLYIKPDQTDAIEKFMRSIMTAYSMYFNKKYRHSGTVFQGPYKALGITDDTSFAHISRYIHMNPKDLKDTDYLTYPYSSLPYYISGWGADWVQPSRMLNDGYTPARYIAFMKDYEDYAKSLKLLKDQVADG